MGSSPLTRGKRDFARDELGCVGLIPAHAGKTSSSHCTKITRRAHPRSHGENSPQKSFVSGVTGSSPLTRGKRRRIDPVPETVGLIPTHAGKTSSSSCITGLSPAHPRSRGQNSSNPGTISVATGSSPLTRGKLGVDALNTLDERLIPAHTGKTTLPPRGLRRGWAHPHSRGENGNKTATAKQPHGSSPLTQGKTSPRNCGRGVGWFIPVDQGKLICIDENHVAKWKAPECTGATSPPHSTPAHANHTQRSSTRHTCALMAEPRSSSRSRMPCPDQFH